MALFEGKTPAERNKLIAGLALPVIALIFVVRMFFGSSTPPRPTSNANKGATRNTATTQTAQGQPDTANVETEILAPVVYNPIGVGGSNAGRNIFVYYVRPVGVAADKLPVSTPLPALTPPPPPPVALNSLSPASVYAKTSSFTLQLSGDKFTSEMRVYLDGQEIPTEFRGPQQLTANVPAATLSAPGARSVVVRTPDNVLFSNTATLNVAQPPSPTHTFIGMIGRRRTATALLKNQKGDLVSVQVNDIVEGRFRITEISERAVELMDKDLNVRHTLPYVEARATGVTGRVPGSIQPPPPPPSNGDEEP